MASRGIIARNLRKNNANTSALGSGAGRYPFVFEYAAEFWVSSWLPPQQVRVNNKSIPKLKRVM